MLLVGGLFGVPSMEAMAFVFNSISGGFRARFTRVFQIASPSVWPSVEQIVGVVHVSVCLALERNVEVSSPAHRQSNEPLDDVEEIEEYKSQFNHLPGMDALMLDKVGRDGRSLAAKQYSQNVDGIIIFEGYQSVVNDEHGCDVNDFLCVSVFYYSTFFLVMM